MSGLDRRGPSGRLLAGRVKVAALGLVVLAVVGAIWWVRAGEPGLQQFAARQAVKAMTATIASAPAGQRVDLAKALTLPWDRAVLMDPYMNGTEMNRVLGFEAYPADATSQLDESAQFLVFVRDRAVVADTVLWPEADSFRFDSGIRDFSRSDAVFVVARDGDLVRLQRP